MWLQKLPFLIKIAFARGRIAPGVEWIAALNAYGSIRHEGGAGRLASVQLLFEI